MICGLLCLVSFTEKVVENSVHLCCSMYLYLSPFYSWATSPCVVFRLSIHLLVNIWVVYTFWLVWVELLRTIVYKILFEHPTFKRQYDEKHLRIQIMELVMPHSLLSVIIQHWTFFLHLRFAYLIQRSNQFLIRNTENSKELDRSIFIGKIGSPIRFCLLVNRENERPAPSISL